ncbi:MAG: SPOR domain-containing protein [Candidatus Omnitrophica bacterium]|nr:SPOR domain-containing protein [Candidatus Omnitrophota bacterium]MCM8825081.1 SPOR domain-containing protein [Candidatus Omnitrophota bacterium]
MEKKNKRAIVALFVLILIFIFTLVRALKPAKPRTVVINTGESTQNVIIDQQGLSQTKDDKVFDFQQVDVSLSKLLSIIKHIEEQEKQAITIETTKNPFRQPNTLTVKMPSEPSSILKQDYASAPDFRISGILYDKDKPMVIIDDEVKMENEIKSGYTIYRIFADRIILRHDNKEYTLYVNSPISTGFITDEIKMSDVTKTRDTEVFVENKAYPPLKQSEYYISETFEKLLPVIHEKAETEKRKYTLLTEGNSQKIITVQVASFGINKQQQAIEFARTLEDSGFENVRVERINGFYTVRAGKSNDKNDLTDLCQKLKQFSSTAFIRTAYLIQNRIIYPPAVNINL